MEGIKRNQKENEEDESTFGPASSLRMMKQEQANKQMKWANYHSHCMFSIPLLGIRLRTRAYSSRPMFFIAGRAVLRGGQSVQHWIKIRPVFFIAGRAALRGGQPVQHL